jgi:hypothetical protein
MLNKSMNGCDSVRDPSDEAHSVAAFVHSETAVGDAAEQTCGRSANDTFTSTVEGVVVRVDDESLWLRAHANVELSGLAERRSRSTPSHGQGSHGQRSYGHRSHGQHEDDVCVLHELPVGVDLGYLVGRSVRATTVSEQVASETPSRTLTIQDDDGRAWLIARTGPVHGVTHAVSPDAPTLHAALSQRPDGPLVIGTSELQWLVPVGQSALVCMPNGALFRALLARRNRDGTASYVIVDERLVIAKLS